MDSHTITSSSGLALRAITYGARVVSLQVPDREGRLADVVLGFSNLAAYVKCQAYLGATVGRVAGRITKGHFSLEGEDYRLAVNDSPNHLHGGTVGFDRRIWAATSDTHPDGSASIRFVYHSPDGEEGYPGNVTATVTYILKGNAFIVEYHATTDRATPFSLTHHSYFNLAGEGVSGIEDHRLQILADSYAPADEHLTLLGRREPVAGQACDLREARRLGDVVPHLHKTHGDLYFLHDSGQSPVDPRPVARLADPKSGRVMTVSTTESCLQFYSGVFFNGSLTGKLGHRYRSLAGLCLECEGYPDGVNTPSLGNIILAPGRPYRETTIYSFSTGS